MSRNDSPNYLKDPSGTRARTVIQCGVNEERRLDRIEPEEARRILKEETPKTIERLRRDLRDLYLSGRDRGRRYGREERAA